METANARALKHETSALLDLVEQGESFQITRHGKVVALLSPLETPSESARWEEIRNHDFEKDLREIFGDRMMPTTATEMMAEERGDR